MAFKDNFGDRMKAYEKNADHKLTPRLPVILRLDGNSFSKFTKDMKFKKPFDDKFCMAMEAATTAVLEYCSGSQIGYFQSDEITVLLRNDQTHETDPFLSNRIQKICSLVASTCTLAFNNFLTANIADYYPRAAFDCRCFVVPPKEVNNVFLWRQKDAWRNCVSAVAYYGLKEKKGRKTSFKMLQGKSNSEQQELIFSELGINMNDYETRFKRGVCIVKEIVQTPIEEFVKPEIIEKYNKKGEMVERSVWKPDYEIPLFNEDKLYIEKFVVKPEKVIWNIDVGSMSAQKAVEYVNSIRNALKIKNDEYTVKGDNV